MTNSIQLFVAIALTIVAGAFTSCTTIYYVGQTSDSVKLYNSEDTSTLTTYIIPKGSTVLTTGKSKKYHYLIYETYKGYAYKPIYLNYHKYNSSIDGELYGYSTKKKKSYSSSNGNSGGEVNVKGYYRKDGTYVRPHTRSAPKRKN